MPLSRPAPRPTAAVAASPPASPEPHKTHMRKRSTPRAVRPTLRRRSTHERKPRAAPADTDDDSNVAADESFWNFCTYCDKQMDGQGSSGFLYCSENCRHLDLSPSHHHYPATPPLSPHISPLDGPDIIPRASPTLAIPLLNAYDPFLQPPATAVPQLPCTSALASLRSLSSGLAARRPSREEDTDDGCDHAADSAWGYNPFATAPPSPRPQYAAEVRGASWGYAAAPERPLPPRGAGFGYRTRSVDLITPVGGF